MNMFLIVGLGNPEKKFEKTRHNLGSRIVEKFAEENNFPTFRLSKKLLSQISKGKICGKQVILAKPETYMNESGKAVKRLLSGLRLSKENLYLVHDDIDLALGHLKVVKNRGTAGHKGVESVVKELKTKNFVRFRIGIQPKEGKPKNLNNLVLNNFSTEEEKIIKEVIKKTIRVLEIALNQGIERAMAVANARLPTKTLDSPK